MSLTHTRTSEDRILDNLEIDAERGEVDFGAIRDMCARLDAIISERDATITRLASEVAEARKEISELEHRLDQFRSA